ncbi:DWNN domain protein [Aphelenchoides bicaudatus]|nr:DWNN domain protein [Aphelenchoides bicaudatus]
MCSIHYRFRSLKTFTTINFDRLEIPAEEVKESILGCENLSPEVFDLILENAYFKRTYESKDMIPRNAALVIKRIPRHNAIKIPKVHDTATSGIVSKRKAEQSVNFLQADLFSKMSEEERLHYVTNVSYEKYHPSNYEKRPRHSVSSGEPPASYVCNRCRKPGHWIRDCSLVIIRFYLYLLVVMLPRELISFIECKNKNVSIGLEKKMFDLLLIVYAKVKRTTGIPMEELCETTPDDPHAMLHPSGRYMARKMHVKARLESKAKAPIPFARDEAVKSDGSDGSRPATPNSDEASYGETPFKILAQLSP